MEYIEVAMFEPLFFSRVQLVIPCNCWVARNRIASFSLSPAKSGRVKHNTDHSTWDIVTYSIYGPTESPQCLTLVTHSCRVLLVHTVRLLDTLKVSVGD